MRLGETQRAILEGLAGRSRPYGGLLRQLYGPGPTRAQRAVASRALRLLARDGLVERQGKTVRLTQAGRALAGTRPPTIDPALVAEARAQHREMLGLGHEAATFEALEAVDGLLKKLSGRPMCRPQ